MLKKLICFLIALPGFAQAVIPEDMAIVSVSGSGCDKRQVSAFWDHSRDFVTVLPQAFSSSLNNREFGIAKVSTCKMRLSVGLPAGMGLVAEEASFDGVSNLRLGARAYLHTEFYFDEAPEHLINATSFEGPMTRAFFRENAPGDSKLQICGRRTVHLNFQSNIILSNRRDNADRFSYLRVDRIRIPARLVPCQ